MSAPSDLPAPRAPASESTVYLGRDVAGTVIVERKGQVTALDAAGRRLGIFQTDREAMAAILRAARESAR
jgi:hypothetical protein